MACAAYFNQEADEFIFTCTNSTDLMNECRAALALYIQYWTTHVVDTRNGEICSVCTHILLNEPVVPNTSDTVAHAKRVANTRNHLRAQQIAQRRPHVASGLLMSWYYFTKLFQIDVRRSVETIDPVSVAFHFLIGCCKTMMSEAGSPVDLCQAAVQNCITMRQMYPVQRNVRSLTVKQMSGFPNEHEYCAFKQRRRHDSCDYFDDNMSSDDSSTNETAGDEITRYSRVIKRFVDEISVACNVAQPLKTGDETDGACTRHRPCIISNVGDVRVSIQAQRPFDDFRGYVSYRWITETLGANYIMYMDADAFGCAQPGLSHVDDEHHRERTTNKFVNSRPEVAKMFMRESDVVTARSSCEIGRRTFDVVNEKRPKITSIHAISQRAEPTTTVLQSSDETVSRLRAQNEQKSGELLKRALFLASIDAMFTSACAENNSDMNGMNLLFHECVWCTLCMLAPMRAICWDLVQMIRTKLSSLGLGLRVPGARSMPSLNDEVRKKRTQIIKNRKKCGNFKAGVDGLPVPGSFSSKCSGTDRYVSKSLLPGARSADKRRALGIDKPNATKMAQIFDEGELSAGTYAIETIETGVNAVRDGVVGERYTYDFVGKVPTICTLKTTFDEWATCKFPLIQQFLDALPGATDSDNIISSLWEHLSSNGNPLCGANIRRTYTDTDIHQGDNHECFMSTAINLMMTCSRVNTAMKQSDFRKLEDVAKRHMFSVRFLDSTIMRSVV